LRVLALDTTSPRGSVALLEGEDSRGEIGLSTEKGHSRWLLPAIDFLLRELGLRASDLNAYAVAAGPGSFTGIRVGISTVQGLALASPRPCLGLDVLDALAALALDTADTLVALRDAGPGEVYAALYDRNARPRGERGVRTLESLLEAVRGPAAFVGDGAENHRAQIQDRLPQALFPPGSPFLAAALGRLAGPRLAAGEGGGPECLRPLYLRDAHIRKPLP
jgi:tRNA threonylcarbamoyladenosine biosynthesis protein TsaB